MSVWFSFWKERKGQWGGGVRVTHLGAEKPPGKSQVGAGHRYCLGQHFLSMWQIQWWMEQLHLKAQSFSICNISSVSQTHTKTTQMPTNTHTCTRRHTHALSQQDIVLQTTLTVNSTTGIHIYNTFWDYFPVDVLLICQDYEIWKHHWVLQFKCSLINKFMSSFIITLGQNGTKIKYFSPRICSSLRFTNLNAASPPQHLIEVKYIIRQCCTLIMYPK